MCYPGPWARPSLGCLPSAAACFYGELGVDGLIVGVHCSATLMAKLWAVVFGFCGFGKLKEISSLLLGGQVYIVYGRRGRW